MTKADAKNAGNRFFQLVTDLRVILAALGILAGGTSMRVFGDAGATRAQVEDIADSISQKQVEPIIRHLARQDTAIIQIKFSLDVMMTDNQKTRADSLMRSALKNINYGGTQ